MRRILLSIAQFRVLRRVCLMLALFLIGLIFGMADTPLATGGLNFQPPLDKLLHAGVYGTIAALLWFSGILRSRAVIWLLVVGIGAVDEIQQCAIVGRESSLSDLLADTVGVTLGLWMASLILSIILVQHSKKFNNA